MASLTIIFTVVLFIAVVALALAEDEGKDHSKLLHLLRKKRQSEKVNSPRNLGLDLKYSPKNLHLDGEYTWPGQLGGSNSLTGLYEKNKKGEEKYRLGYDYKSLNDLDIFKTGFGNDGFDFSGQKSWSAPNGGVHTVSGLLGLPRHGANSYGLGYGYKFPLGQNGGQHSININYGAGGGTAVPALNVGWKYDFRKK